MSGLTFGEYQGVAKTTALPTAMDLNYLIPGLVAEAGEVAGKYAKIIRDKNGDISAEDRLELLKEVGDVLWFLALIAEHEGETLDRLAQENLEKLLSRKNRGVLGGSGDNR